MCYNDLIKKEILKTFLEQKPLCAVRTRTPACKVSKYDLNHLTTTASDISVSLSVYISLLIDPVSFLVSQHFTCKPGYTCMRKKTVCVEI